MSSGGGRRGRGCASKLARRAPRRRGVAADIDVEAGEVGRGVEEIDEILAAEDVGFGEPVSVGADFFRGDRGNTGGFGLGAGMARAMASWSGGKGERGQWRLWDRRASRLIQKNVGAAGGS